MNQILDFEKSINNAKAYVKKVASDLKPENCEIFLETKTDRHYTIVVMIPTHIASKMDQFQKKLLEIESSLVTGSKDLMHLTLIYLPGDRDIDEIKMFLEDYFKGSKFGFSLSGLFISSKGMGVAAYPSNDTLINLRMKMGEKFDFPFSLSGLEHISWITLARVSKKPSQEFIDYLKLNFDKDFGSFQVSKVDIFENKDKTLAGAKKLFSIPLELN